jgi:alcohol dehydrogenase
METDNRMEMRKFVIPEFVFGDGALNLVGRYVKNFASKKVLLVSDPGVVEAGWAEKIEGKLQKSRVQYAFFKDITPNPKDNEVMLGAQLYKEEGCDVIIAIGGGSPMDCAKAIGVVCTNNRNVLDFEGVDEVPLPGPPLICIPTTAGTAADISQFSIITDTKRKNKIAIISKTMVPDVSLIDPITTTTMNPELTAATGMDALAHAFEAYVSNASSMITDLSALEAVKLISNNLAGAFNEPDNLEYREKMMTASTLAGMAFSNASLGLVHSMAHSLGGLLDLAHGDCNAILLEKVVDFNFYSAKDKYIKLADAIGVDTNKKNAKLVKENLISSIKDLRKKVGINKNLGEMGVSKKIITKLSKFALKDPCSATNPRELNLENIEKVYEKAL